MTTKHSTANCAPRTGITFAAITVEAGLFQEISKEKLLERERGLRILLRNNQANLGWRIILSTGDQGVARQRVSEAAAQDRQLFEVIPARERDAILAEAAALPPEALVEVDATVARIKLTSYEGSKGLSAQYVILVGVHANELPRNADDVKDIEICRFLVGLTRTRKKCTFLITRRFGQDLKQPSCFVGWISSASYNRIEVNAAYWP